MIVRLLVMVAKRIPDSFRKCARSTRHSLVPREDYGCARQGHRWVQDTG